MGSLVFLSENWTGETTALVDMVAIFVLAYSDSLRGVQTKKTIFFFWNQRKNCSSSV